MIARRDFHDREPLGLSWFSSNRQVSKARQGHARIFVHRNNQLIGNAPLLKPFGCVDETRNFDLTTSYGKREYSRPVAQTAGIC